MPYTPHVQDRQTGGMSSFGDRLRVARAAQAMTQDELADALGVTKSAVSAWENDRELPGFERLGALREQLHVSLDELVCGTANGANGAGHVADGVGPYRADPRLNRDEQRLLRRVRKLTDGKRKALIKLLDD